MRVLPKQRPVTDAEFRHILIAERDKLLRELEFTRSCLMTVVGINHGCCDHYAETVCEQVAGARMYWMNDHAAFEQIVHCVIKYQGRYYDAECIDGVDELKDIPLYANLLKDQEEIEDELSRLIEAHGWMAILNKERKTYNYHIVISNAARPHAAHAACNHGFPLPPDGLLRVPGSRVCKRCLERCRLLRGMEAIRSSLKEAQHGRLA